MTTSFDVFKKSAAIALAAIFLSLPIANIASAAPKHDHRPPRQEQRIHHKPNHKVHHRADKHQVKHPKHHKQKVVVHRPAPPPRHHHHKDNSDKVVGGLLVGAVLGAIIANNT